MSKKYAVSDRVLKAIEEQPGGVLIHDIVTNHNASGLEQKQIRGALSTLSQRKLIAQRGDFWFSLSQANEAIKDNDDTFLRVLVSREKGFPKNIRLTFTRFGEESLPQEVFMLSPVTITIREGVSDNRSFLNVCSLRVDTLDEHGEVIDSFTEKLNKGEALFVTEGV